MERLIGAGEAAMASRCVGVNPPNALLGRSYWDVHDGHAPSIAWLRAAPAPGRPTGVGIAIRNAPFGWIVRPRHFVGDYRLLFNVHV